MHSTITLVSGRPLVLEALHVQQTYLGLLEGRPNAEINDEVVDELRGQAAKLWGQRRVHVVHPHGASPGDALPAWACVGWFSSKPIQPSEGDTSELVVVWFEHSVFEVPLRALAQDRLESLAWEELAEDCTF